MRKWIGHVLRTPPTALPRVALRWTPDGRRKIGRPKEIWRTVEKRDEGEQLDMESPGMTSARQKPMAHSGRGLMCFETRRGLSKFGMHMYPAMKMLTVFLKEASPGCPAAICWIPF